MKFSSAAFALGALFVASAVDASKDYAPAGDIYSPNHSIKLKGGKNPLKHLSPKAYAKQAEKHVQAKYSYSTVSTPPAYGTSKGKCHGPGGRPTRPSYSSMSSPDMSSYTAQSGSSYTMPAPAMSSSSGSSMSETTSYVKPVTTDSNGSSMSSMTTSTGVTTTTAAGGSSSTSSESSSTSGMTTTTSTSPTGVTTTANGMSTTTDATSSVPTTTMSGMSTTDMSTTTTATTTTTTTSSTTTKTTTTTVAPEPTIDVVPVADYADVNYYGDVVVGGQTFSVVFDTGSADLWIPGVDCDSACGIADRFNSSQSSTYHALNTPVKFVYGKGSATGTEFADTVTLQSTTVSTQVLASVNNATGFPSTFQTGQVDGIMGFSFSTLSKYQKPNFFENAVKAGSVKAPVFGFKLGRYKTVKWGIPSQSSYLDIGGVVKTRYTGDISFVPVTKPGYWQIALKSASISGVNLNTAVSSAIVDTGTSLIVAPPADAAMIAAHFNASPVDGMPGFYEVDCLLNPLGGDGPILEFTLANGVKLSLEPADYLLQGATGNLGTCLIGVQGSDLATKLGSWILGDQVLHKYYSVYNIGDVENGYEGASVGFALASTDEP
ncbi:hypothetical protein HDV00_012478 [Rhizophlyctis rosea]|nr:hypothetical protein HDV00_012478 [Rhizophlyctis rosea]